MNLDAICVLLESRANCNVQPQLEKEEKSGEDDSNDDSYSFKLHQRTQLRLLQSEGDDIAKDCYPFRVAASIKFNNDDLKLKMISIVKTLLTGGADPFLVCSNGNSILHNLTRHSSSLEPFLSFSNIELEACDSKGRALLYAATLVATRTTIEIHWRCYISTNLIRRLYYCS